MTPRSDPHTEARRARQATLERMGATKDQAYGMALEEALAAAEARVTQLEEALTRAREILPCLTPIELGTGDLTCIATETDPDMMCEHCAVFALSLGVVADGESEARPNGELGTPRELTASRPDSLQEVADASDRASLSSPASVPSPPEPARNAKCGDCGHWRDLHYAGFGQPACSASIQPRPDTLTPCSCKGFAAEQSSPGQAG